MIFFKLNFAPQFFKLVFNFIIFQIGYNAVGQNIKLPIYTIKSSELKSLLIKGDRSKLTACILVGDASYNLNNGSILKLFTFHKNGFGTGDRVFKNETVAKLSSRYFDTIFVPFLMSNIEIKMKQLRNLPTSKEIVGDVFYFVPHLKEKVSSIGTTYNLIFTIEYLPITNESFADKKTSEFLAALTKVATLNPCPPARPADYK